MRLVRAGKAFTMLRRLVGSPLRAVIAVGAWWRRRRTRT